LSSLLSLVLLVQEKKAASIRIVGKNFINII